MTVPPEGLQSMYIEQSGDEDEEDEEEDGGTNISSKSIRMLSDPARDLFRTNVPSELLSEAM
jgi:hypothetical protein